MDDYPPMKTDDLRMPVRPFALQRQKVVHNIFANVLHKPTSALVNIDLFYFSHLDNLFQSNGEVQWHVNKDNNKKKISSGEKRDLIASFLNAHDEINEEFV